MIFWDDSFLFVILGHSGKRYIHGHIIIFLFAGFTPELKRSIAGIEFDIDSK